MTTMTSELTHEVPFIPFSEYELDAYPPFPFPHMSSFVPDGWERAGATWRVRTRPGSGDQSLTGDEFRRRLSGYVRKHPGQGFAVMDEDDSVAVVAAFRRTAG